MSSLQSEMIGEQRMSLSEQLNLKTSDRNVDFAETS